MIFSRINEEQIIEKRIGGFLQGYRHNIALIGQPKTGKSALLSKLLQKKFQNTSLLTIYVNLFYVDNLSFTKAALHSLLYNFLKNKSVCKISISLDELIFNTEEYIPKTIELIKQLLTSGSTQKNPVDSLFSVIESIVKEAEIKPLFIVDEFCFFKKFPKRQLSEMTKQILSRTDCMFLFVSSDQIQADEILNNELNILFGKFEKIYLNSFNSTDSKSFLRARLSGKLNADCTSFLSEITGNSPFYLDLLCDALNSLPVNSISEELFIHTLASQLSNKKSVVYQTCYNYVACLKNNSRTDKLTNVLLLIADGYTRRSEIASFMKLESKNLTSRLACLVENNILVKVGSFYVFQNKFLSNWISIVLKTCTYNSFLFGEDLTLCVENILQNRFNEFKSIVNKASFDRFLDLINNFNEDTVKLNRKAIRLPTINKFRVVPAHSDGMQFVIGEAKKSYLIMAFKEKDVKEQDLIEFSNRCSYFKAKQPKKIFVSLDDVNQNVKLLAKEKKMTCWNKNNINTLMSLYNQPALV